MNVRMINQHHPSSPLYHPHQHMRGPYNNSPHLPAAAAGPTNSHHSPPPARPIAHEHTDDLKAFERRLTEVVSQLQPATRRWRLLLLTAFVFVFCFALAWINDPRTSEVTFVQSLHNHPMFAVSTAFLALLFVTGIHKRVVAPGIVTSRCKLVLADFNMSCDDNGKLILKPRPNY